MTNKSISDLSVTTELTSTDLFLISQKYLDYYVSKQIAYDTVANILSTISRNDYLPLIQNVEKESTNKYYTKDKLYVKDTIDEMLSQLKVEIFDKLEKSYFNLYAKKANVFLRQAGQTANTSTDVQIRDNLEYLSACDATISSYCTEMSNIISNDFVSEDVVVDYDVDSNVLIPRSKVVYDLGQKVNSIDNRTKNIVTKIEYNPIAEHDKRGNNFATLNINGTNVAMYTGWPNVDGTTINVNASNGIIGCNDNIMATREWVLRNFSTPTEYNTMPIIDVPLLTPMFFDYSMSNLQWTVSNGQWKSCINNDLTTNELSLIFNHLTADMATATLKSENINGITISYYLATDGHKICTDRSKVDEIYNSTGIAWYYVLDATGNKFILPRTKFAFKGISQNQVGNYISPGLPSVTATCNAAGEHTHSVTYLVSDCSCGAAGGIRNSHAASKSHVTTSSDGYHTHTVTINASNIYGKSTTVQPPATELYLYFCTGFHHEYIERENTNTESWNFTYMTNDGMKTVTKKILTDK